MNKLESAIRKMVLNIAGFSIHTYHFHVSEIILLIVAIILEVASSLCLKSVKTTCAGQCVLFAKLFERARILQGSNTTWCFLPLFFNFVAGSSSLLLLRFISGGRSRLVSLYILAIWSRLSQKISQFRPLISISLNKNTNYM